MPSRREDDYTTSTVDVLSLSFLDVLSCGLGASIYLFLVFSVMPHIGVAGLPESISAQTRGIDAVQSNAGVRLESFDPVAAAPVFVSVHFTGLPLDLAEQIELLWEGFRDQSLPARGPYSDESDGRVTFLSPEITGRRQARSIRCTVQDPESVLPADQAVIVEITAGGRLRRLTGSVRFEASTRLFELNVLLEPTEWVTDAANGLVEPSAGSSGG